MSKKIFVLLLMAGAVICAKAQQVTMMVASDTHVMDKSLFDIPYGEAFIKAMQQDLKVAESSQQLFEQFATIAMRERPQLLLIPGDLTKDGERASHEYMARKLKEIEAGGTKVYVIPGNHDMENPKAVRYNGTKTERVPSVSEAEFREIYKDYGYSEAVSTDSVTGSYMVYPVPGLAIVCLNTNIPNQYKSRYVHGRLFRPTLTWIERAATKARLEGRYVIAMAHHELMQHHNQEDYFAPTAMLNMERGVKNLPALKEVQETLTRSGIHLVLTGHYHIQSVTDTETLHGRLTDISTGSLAGFPSPYRRMTLNIATGKMRITSATLYGNKPSRWPATDLAMKQRDRLRYMVQLYVPKVMGQKVNMTDAYSYLAEPFNKALCALAAGDENGHQPKQVYDQCMKAFDSYACHALNYNAINLNKVRTEKNGPYQKVRDLIRSIMYNYVGTTKHINTDNTYQITLRK